MKKYICFIILSLILTCNGCSKKNNVQIHKVADAKSDFYYNEEDLYHASEVVVIVKKTSSEKNTVKYLGTDAYYGYTLSDVEIETVIKNTSSQNLTEGMTITVLENQFFHEGYSEDIVYHSNYYCMMIPENEYILYLGFSTTDDWYYITTGYEGKLPLDQNEPLLFPVKEITLDGELPADDYNLTEKAMREIQSVCLEKYY